MSEQAASVSWPRRIARFPLVCLLVALLIVGTVAALGILVLHLKPRPGELAPWTTLPLAALLAVGAVVGQLLAGVLLERESLAALGWPRPVMRPLLVGLGLGALLQGLVVAVLALASFYALAPGHAATGGDLFGSTLLFLAAAAYEEVIFRGILFRQLERLLGSWVALALTAAFFGLSHRSNPGATPLSSAAIAVEAGVLLGAAYAATRTLWLPIGLHWAWNFFEGPIFGEEVSGGAGPHWLVAKISGPALWTGGSFGPEAGMVAVILCTAVGVGFLVLAVRRRRMLWPAWMRRLVGAAPT